MIVSTHTCCCYRTVGPFDYRADFGDPASKIEVRFHDIVDPRHPNDNWDITPFTVERADHDRRRAEELIAKHYRD